jgi:serpin B
MMKGAAKIALLAVCMSCQSAKESVEDAAAHTDADFGIDETEEGIISATNDFSFRLFQSLAANNNEKDFIFSPLGAVYSLEIISNGAGGHTQNLLQRQLGTSQYSFDDINALRRKMMLYHAKVVEDDFLATKTAFMKSSNLLLFRERKTIKQDYVQTIGHDYFADCLSYQNEDDAKSIVDTWNKETNHGTFKDIPMEFDTNADIYLINTLLFNGAWVQEFYDAKPDTFFVTKDDVRIMDMMSKTEKEGCFWYMQNNQYAMLRMPYVGSFYMDVILPNENLTVDSLIKQMNMEQYKNSTKVLKKYDIIDVSFPKFHVKSEIDLKFLLAEMGLTDIFSKKADLSLMSDSPLYVNKMKQNNEIDVDEKGTHVEAITSTSFATLSEVSKPTRAEFYANRPFIYFIRDNFGSICFAGVYRGRIHRDDRNCVYLDGK